MRHIVLPRTDGSSVKLLGPTPVSHVAAILGQHIVAPALHHTTGHRASSTLATGVWLECDSGRSASRSGSIAAHIEAPRVEHIDLPGIGDHLHRGQVLGLVSRTPIHGPAHLHPLLPSILGPFARVFLHQPHIGQELSVDAIGRGVVRPIGAGSIFLASVAVVPRPLGPVHQGDSLHRLLRGLRAPEGTRGLGSQLHLTGHIDLPGFRGIIGPRFVHRHCAIVYATGGQI